MGSVNNELLMKVVSNVVKFRDKSRDVVSDTQVIYTCRDLQLVTNRVGSKISFDSLYLNILGERFEIHADGTVLVVDFSQIEDEDLEDFDDENMTAEDAEREYRVMNGLISVNDDAKNIYALNTYLQWRQNMFEQIAI